MSPIDDLIGELQPEFACMRRLYGVNRLDALSPGIRATALALLDTHVSDFPRT
jgi:hypothetical protein